MDVISLMSARVDAFLGATAHFHITQGVGDVADVDNVKGVATEMPKHTTRRASCAANLPYDEP